MAKVSLRAYIHEIDTFIDHGQVDEAIGHCKFILKHFPKHIEIYRLLGKAYLENRRYAEATDILARILAVVPDDYISQIGMSIIREDEGNFDAAIFHMERAFEVQPSNTAIQEELKRLYGRRDGIEPPKIRLSRSALVRMYARGELYNQAVAEARAAIAEDPQRIDIELLLARMLFLSGQKLESAQVCRKIREKLPYCYEANEILAKFCLAENNIEDAKTHQQIINALEPYYTFVSENAQSPALVPENAITLERLEWSPPNESTQQPEWAKTIGVDIQPKEDIIPDWMAPQQQAEPPLSGNNITSDVFPEKPGDIGDTVVPSILSQQIIEPNDQEELPEWLVSPPSTSDQVDSDSPPEWMTEFPTNFASQPFEQVDNPPDSSTPSLPTPIDMNADPDSVLGTLDELPDWMKTYQTETNTDSTSTVNKQEDVIGQVTQITDIQNPFTNNPMDIENDKADPFSEQSIEERVIKPDFQNQSTSRDDNPAQSEGMHPSMEDLTSETISQTDSPSNQIEAVLPDWIEQFHNAEDDEATPGIIPGLAQDEGMPEWLRAFVPVENAGNNIDEVQGVPPEESSQPFENEETAQELAPTQDQPILENLPASDEIPEEIAEIPSGFMEIPPAEKSVSSTSAQDESQKTEEFPSWLQGLDNIQPEIEQLSTDAIIHTPEPRQVQNQDELPGWLQNIGAPDIEKTQAPYEDEILPTWLQNIEVSEPPSIEEIRQPSSPETILTPAGILDAEVPPGDTIVTLEFHAAINEPINNEPAMEVPTSEVMAEDEDDKRLVPEVIQSSTQPVSLTRPDAEADKEVEQIVETEPSTEVNDILSMINPEAGFRDDLKITQEPIAPAVISATPVRNEKVVDGFSDTDGMENLLTLLEHARLSLKQNDLPTAIEQYGMLIQTGKYLDDLIKDLQDALYDHPIDINLWETLGDAHFKAHHIQEALDAFTKAEELFR